VLSVWERTQLKSLARCISAGVDDKRMGTSVLYKASLSLLFSAPDGAYMFIIFMPSKLTAIPLPDGRRVVLVRGSPSLAKIAVPLFSVPTFT
jgi:hypothetical protein